MTFAHRAILPGCLCGGLALFVVVALTETQVIDLMGYLMSSAPPQPNGNQ